MENLTTMKELPRMSLPTFNRKKVYDSLSTQDTDLVGFPTNYYLLSLDQRDFIDSIMLECEKSLNHHINDFNDDLSCYEQDDDTFDDDGTFDD